MLKNLPNVGSVNLYDVFKDQYKDKQVVYERVGLFFATPWSIQCHNLAQLLGYLKLELNKSVPHRNFLDLFIVPADIHENDERGFK